MARFTVRLSIDEVADARRRAKKRGDRGPLVAIGEKAISVGCRRKWEGHFHNLERWDIWKKLGRVPRTLEARMVDAVIVDLELEEHTPEDHVVVLVGTREAHGSAPVFLLIGWTFAGDAQKQKYWREDSRRFVMPHADLRSCWELKRYPKRRSARIHPNDPADDFAGHGPSARMLDTDDGKPASHYGNVIRSKWALPCRRCQTVIPAGALTGGNLRTGNIHGDPAECRFTADNDE